MNKLRQTHIIIPSLQGISDTSASLSQYYPARHTPTLEPTDPDTDHLSLSHGSRQSTSNARKSIAPRKKNKPIRRTVPSDLSKLTKNLPEIKLTAIDGERVFSLDLMIDVFRIYF